MCLLASAAVLVYALIVANGMGVYLQAIPAFAEDLSTFSPSRMVAISLAVCWRRFKSDQACRLNFDQGPAPGFLMPGCG
jgi:hypothetical protein